MMRSFKKFFIYSAFVANVLLMSGVSAHAETNKILIYGDSLSAAYKIPRESGWVALLQKRLESQAYAAEVVNVSVTGETSAGGVRRITQTLKLHRPDVVVLELGANDGLRHLPIEDTRNNLASIIYASQTQGARVVLAGMKMPLNLAPSYRQAFEQMYFSLVKEFGLSYIPFFLEGVAGNPALNQEDGLHPTAAAQGIILDNVWAVLKSMLVNQHQAKP